MDLDQIKMYFAAKYSTIAAAMFAAILSVLLEVRQHSLFTATLAIVSGVTVAAFATTPVLEFWNLPDSWEHAIAAVLGITGRNVIIWIGRAAKDPLKFWQTIKIGSKDGE